MKNAQYFLFLLLLAGVLYSCDSTSGNSHNENDAQEPVSNNSNTELSEFVNSAPEIKNADEFGFEPVLGAYPEEIVGVEIYYTSEPQILQTIEGIKGFYFESPENAIETGDYNFDGFIDFRIMSDIPAGANIPHQYWVYDEAKGEFVKDQHGLSEISSAEFDRKTQRVISYWRGSCCHHGKDVYEFVDGVTKKIKTVEISFIEDTTGLVIKYPEKGVSDTIFNGKVERYDLEAVEFIASMKENKH